MTEPLATEATLDAAVSRLKSVSPMTIYGHSNEASQKIWSAVKTVVTALQLLSDVESLAKAYYESAEYERHWDKISEGARDVYRRRIRRTLEILDS